MSALRGCGNRVQMGAKPYPRCGERGIYCQNGCFDYHLLVSMSETFCGLSAPGSTASDGKDAFFGKKNELLRCCPTCTKEHLALSEKP